MNMTELQELLPFLTPLILVQLVMIVMALFDLARRSQTRGPKWMWVLIILFINLIGPIVYFVIGRDEA